MKKKTALIISAVLAGSMAVTLCGCDLFGGNRSDSSFAYDGAVAGGYHGTEAEYMADQDTPSTAERRCYEAAVANGEFSGTYVEFLKQFRNTESSDGQTVNQALTSVVCVEASFSGATSRGSGVIYSLDRLSGDAYIVTNYHVVYSKDIYGRFGLSNKINVYLYGGETSASAISATFYGGAMSYDIAVLKVTGSQLLKSSSATAAKIADSDSVTVGERVYALGNPNGEGFSVSSGVVSVAAEYISVLRADERETLSLLEIRTDTAVNHGNSGGGLFNANGELVGIVNARREQTNDGTALYGFGYAIPSALVAPLVQNILDHGGNAVAAQLGITAQVTDSKGVYDERTGKYYIEEKLVVNSFASTAGAGYNAGLKRGDTLLSASIVSASGTEKTVQLTRLHMLSNLLFEIESGDTLRLVISRSDEMQTVSILFNQSSYFKTLV